MTGEIIAAMVLFLGSMLPLYIKLFRLDNKVTTVNKSVNNAKDNGGELSLYQMVLKMYTTGETIRKDLETLKKDHARLKSSHANTSRVTLHAFRHLERHLKIDLELDE